ncbi:recombinase family protein [Planococcus sp. ISL-109]|uniref:recombinase family protein n=1 Tax=Planococcus sp. ISL-109 TaxID=2819166 RepID=UPI001BEAEE53|nr:recombinase family protein [Planococcus sp. ISL-109]
MRIGYARAIAEDIDCQKQRALFEKFGCDVIHIETHSAPKQRSELKKMLAEVKTGDQIIVLKLHVLADSTRQLVDLVEMLEEKEAFLHSEQENIDTAKGKSFSFLEITKCLADFQSDVISEKTKAGLSEAKQKGMHAGRPRKADANVKKAIEMYKSKSHSLAEIKEQTGISKSTLYRYLEN